MPRLFIEAESFDDAVEKAEELGCYWYGVDKGIDCSCCGDRWNKWHDKAIDLEECNNKGYRVSVYDRNYYDEDAIIRWNKRYSKYEIIEEPTWEERYGIKEYVGRIRLHDIEEYAQFFADEYGWTTPDARIYYNDGNVKKIFSKKMMAM